MWSFKILFTLSLDISSLYFQIIHLYPILLYHYFYGLNYSIFNLTEHSQLRFSRTGAPADRRQMSETTVTLEDFEGLQAQLLQMKTENYNLLEQVEAATLHEFRFRAAGCEITLHDTEVICTGPGGGAMPYNGSLGADFVRAFRRLTVNYVQMFIRGE